ncbi:DUF6924 domain-containing protein [Actinoallomurus iriomotensis]|uniref:DUF6924 domain-containing protein n=1 Tax=Actinoallomurus iriomotensis TaxID=478107 RepID=A0A9W6VPW3_9ACTN|nr:hypothetical protein [Actinoallomurus iriomotensis]GLY80393.1 hypothetical protein Airi01_086600 [Actinoallomurus iriomotensis]
MTAGRLAESDHSPLLRTDFTDDQAWRSLLDEVGDDWLTVMEDAGHRGLSVPELLALVPDDSRYPVLVVADDVTFSSAERPLLLVDLREEPGRTFRAGPDAFRSAIGNLAIQNQSFDDYVRCLDDSGVYRISDRQRQALAELQALSRPTTDMPHVSIPGPGASRAHPGEGAHPTGPALPSVPPES